MYTQVAQIDKSVNDIPFRGLFVTHYPTLYLFHVDGDDGDSTAFSFSDFNGENTKHDERERHSHFSLDYLLDFLEAYAQLPEMHQRGHTHPLINVRADKRARPPGCGEAIENSAAYIHCNDGHSISHVLFASYGTPTGACGAYKMEECHAPKSQHTVSEMCVGKSECVVPTTGAIFGKDPCYGRTKRLAVQVLCTPDVPGTAESEELKAFDESLTDEKRQEEMSRHHSQMSRRVDDVSAKSPVLLLQSPTSSNRSIVLYVD